MLNFLTPPRMKKEINGILIAFLVLAVLIMLGLALFLSLRLPLCKVLQQKQKRRPRVSVVCFITRKLTVHYAKSVDLLLHNQPCIRGYFVVDEDNADDEAVELRNATKLFVNDKTCSDAFYTHLNWFKPVFAWEKCLYALNYVIPNDQVFRHAWIIEDDCAFASPRGLGNILDSYHHSNSDLIATHIETRSSNPDWPNWHYAASYFGETAGFKSFNVIMRISRDLLAACDTYIKDRKRAGFLEVFL